MLILSIKKKKYLEWLNNIKDKDFIVFCQLNYKDLITNSGKFTKQKLNYYFLTMLSKKYFLNKYRGVPIYMYIFKSYESFYKFLSEEKSYNILFFSLFNKSNSINLYFYSNIVFNNYLYIKSKLIIKLKNILVNFLFKLTINFSLLIKLLKFKLN